MLGAIIGDIAGSRFEWANHKSKEFDLLTYKCSPTDDSIMTIPQYQQKASQGVANDSSGCHHHDMARYSIRNPADQAIGN